MVPKGNGIAWGGGLQCSESETNNTEFKKQITSWFSKSPGRLPATHNPAKMAKILFSPQRSIFYHYCDVPASLDRGRFLTLPTAAHHTYTIATQCIPAS